MRSEVTAQSDVVAQGDLAIMSGTPDAECIRDATATYTGQMCTANDVRISGYRYVSGVVDDACFPGEQITVTLKATIESGPDRYDVGLWVDQQGFDAKTAEGFCSGQPENTSCSDTNPCPTGQTCLTSTERNRCFRDYLQPVSSTNTDVDLFGGLGPFFNGELSMAPDTCGDVPAASAWNIPGDLGPCTGGSGGTCVFTYYEFTATITCSDSDGDGSADVGTCTSWDNSATTKSAQACDSVNWEMMTLPGTSSKCNCGRVNISGLKTNKTGTISVNKVVSPSTDTGKFSLQIDGATSASDVGHGGTTGAVTVSAGTVPPGTGAMHSVGEVAGTGTTLADYDTAIACVDDQGHTAAASNAGPVSFTVLPDANWVCTITNTVKSASLSLVKSALPTTYSAPGTSITYAYVLTNSGAATLSAPYAVTDDKATVFCPSTPAALAPSSTVTCTATYLTTQADLDAGSVTNHATGTATFHGGTVTSNQAQATITAVPTPSLQLVKTATPTTYSNVGDVIAYSYLLENTGNVTLSAPYAITDDKTTATCSSSAGLAPGATTICSATYTITQDDLDAGSVTNTASATAMLGGAPVASNQDSETVTAVQAPSLMLAKSADPTTFDSVGDVIGYTLVATNDGNVTLHGVSISDPLLGALDCTPSQPAILAPGATLTCTGSYTITQAELDAGKLENTATATGTGPAPTNEPVSDQASASATATQSPALTLTKTPTEEGFGAAGTVLHYTLVAKNTGNVTLTSVSISDPLLGTLLCDPSQPATLAPGAILTCTGSYAVSQADVDAGKFDNTATASGTGPAGQSVSAEDSASVPANQSPHLSLTKTPRPTGFDGAGDVITYELVATNDGNVTLTDVSISDPLLGALSCSQPVTLAPGASLTCTGSYTATQGDVDAGEIDNTASASGDDPDGTPVSDTAFARVPATQGPQISITKVPVPNPTTYTAPGQLIQYEIVATNDGNVTLHDVLIADPKLGALTCTPSQPASLLPGASITCTGSYAVTQHDLDEGVVTNIAFVSAKGPQDQGVGDSATAQVFGAQSPGLALIKSADVPSYDAVGDVIGYTLVATNTGNVTLSGVEISDPSLILICDPLQPADLAPGASITCTGSHAVTQTDLDAGSVYNVAGARGASPTNDPVDAPPDEVTVPAVQNPLLTLAKTALPTAFDSVGDAIGYTLVATNDGNVTLHGVSISDPLLVTLTCTPSQPASLAPGEALSCTGSYTITQDDLDAGKRDNTATATGTGPQDQPVSDEDSANTTASQNPHLKLEKTATESGFGAVGNVLHYTVVATNDGNVTLHDVSITDPKLGTLTCIPTQPATLAPTEKLSCTGSYTVTQSDVDAGKFDNTASAAGKGPQDEPVSDEDSATVPANRNPHLSLTKTPSPTSFDSAGDVIGYTLVATNDGNVTLTDVSISDPKLGALTCTQPVTLAPGATLTCTGSYTATQGDVDAGEIGNTATASGDDPDGTPVSATASATVLATQGPHISITKTPAPTRYSLAGQVIGYILVATNDGNVTLTDVSISDPKLGALTCSPAQPAVLLPGAQLTCEGAYTILQSDLDAGMVTNLAFVTAKPPRGNPVGNSADAAVHGDQAPALELAKSADVTSYSYVGEVITYALIAKNSGNVTLTNVEISDPSLILSCIPLQPATLAPGATLSCTGSHIITQTDLDAGSVYNAGVATGTPPTGSLPPVSDDVTVPAVQRPGLDLTKSANATTFSKVGDVIDYTLVATNSGNVTLTNVSISDPKLSALTCSPAQPASLAPGATLSCTGSYTIVQSDLDAGFVHNAAAASGTPPAGGEIDAPPAEVEVPASQHPALSLTKVATETGFGAAGAVLHYTLVATNDGNVTLHDVSIADPLLGTLTCTQPVTLAPGATLTCTGSYAVSQADVDAGKFDNTASASGKGPQDQPVSATDDATVPAAREPKLSLTKTPSPTGFENAGDVITYTLIAKNVGNVTLTDVSIVDPLLGALTCTPAQPATLAPDATLTCTGSYTAQQADVDAGQIDNTATVTGHPPVGEPVSATANATVPATQRPNILLAKAADPALYDHVGQVITYTLLATNAGNVTLHDVVVSDPKLGALVCTATLPATLAPKASLSCTGTYVITQVDLDDGSVTNLAFVTAKDPDGVPVSNSANTTVIGDQAPALELTKSADATSYSYVGEVITYALIAKNSGNVTLTNVEISDPSLILSCIPLQPATLAPGATLTCTGSHIITQTDLDAGSVNNAAAATGTAPTGPLPPVSDDVTVPAVQNPSLALTKTATPTLYSAAGQVITYSYVMTNAGNVTLVAPFAVSDDKATVTCAPASSLAPGATLSCTAQYVIQAADVSATYDGSVTNHATASAAFGATTVLSNQATATVNQTKPAAQMAPTATTCQQYASGTSPTLLEALYNVKGRYINSVAPGVAFYYATIVPTSSSFTLTVSQSNTLGWKAMPIQDLGQVILWDSSCNKAGALTTGYDAATGQVTTSVEGVTPNSVYYLSVKYVPSGVAGQQVSKPYPVDPYTFKVLIGAIEQPFSDATLTLVSKR